MRGIRRSGILCLLMIVGVVGRLQAAEITDSTFFPTLYVGDKSKACSVGFALTDADREARWETLNAVLELEWAFSEFWRGYRLGGIDYVEFRSFYVVTSVPCDVLAPRLSRIGSYPGVTRDRSMDALGQDLLSEINDFVGLTVLEYFLKLRSPTLVRNCLVRIRQNTIPEPGGRPDAYLTRMQGSSGRTASLYLFPFLFTVAEYDYLGVVISDHCSAREAIMEAFRRKMIEDRSPDAANWEFDYSGDANEFLRRFVPKKPR